MVEVRITRIRASRARTRYSYFQRTAVEGVDEGGLTRLLFLRHLLHAALTLVGGCRTAEVFDIVDEDLAIVMRDASTPRHRLHALKPGNGTTAVSQHMHAITRCAERVFCTQGDDNSDDLTLLN
jgi:hypothetical protein